MRLGQDQWNWIFDYAFTLLIAALYATVFWVLDLSPWIAIVFIHHDTFTWRGAFPRETK